ncbi:hypothetical protein [Winogradskyella sp. UBA3174]|uniref:hypothetical protein n=1 Tax=Winogradskyella sp. UBA3174 TaxID=1947785 RepID=UPI0025EADEA0|nr:hypothetical protein [Winogradskyella sp. UBA3174]
MFIGILVAIQINNCNEQRKDNQTEKNLLIGLQNEFNNNLENIDANIVVNQKKHRYLF